MRLLTSVVLGSAVFCTSPAIAQDISGEVGIAGLYDSHLTNDDIDVESDEGDFGARLDAEIEVQLVDTDRFEFGVGYDFGQTLYADRTDFNLQTHRLGADVGVRAGGVKFGLGYDFMHIRLGGNALFDRQTITPTISGFVSDGVYARAYYTYLDKDFDVTPGRDATGHEVGASLFRFFDGNRGFVSVRGSVESENAVDPAYDFDGFLVGVGSAIPLTAAKDGPRARLGLNYRERNYDAITPSIGAIREEQRWRAEAGLEVPIKGGLRGEAEYRYTDRSSNLPSADYTEHRITTGLVYEF